MNSSSTTTSSKASSPSVMSDLMAINKWFTLLTNALKMVFVVAALLSALNATAPIAPTNPATRVVQLAQLEDYVAEVKAVYEHRLAAGIIKEDEIDFADFLLIYSFTKEDLLGRCFYRAYNNATLLAGNTPANLRDFSLYHLLLTTVIISRIKFSNSNSQDDYYRGLAIDTKAKMDAIIDLMRANKCFSMTTSTTENLETATQFAENPNNSYSAVIFIFGDMKAFSTNVAKYSEYPHEDENIIAANMVKFDVKIGKLHGTYSVVLTKPTLSTDFSRYFSELLAHCIPQILGIWNAHVCDDLLIRKLHTVSHAAYHLIEKLVRILKDESQPIEDRWLAFDRSLTVPLDVNAARVLLMECIELLLAPLPGIQDEYGSQSLIITAFSNISDIVNQFCALMEPSTNSLSCVQSMPASVALIISLDADGLVNQMNHKEFTPHMSILHAALSGCKDVNVMCTGDLNAHGYHNNRESIMMLEEDRTSNNLSLQMLALEVSGKATSILPDTCLVSNINTPLSCTFKGTLKHQRIAKLSAYVVIPTKCEFVINVTVMDGTDEEHVFQTAQIQSGKFEMNIDVAEIKKITAVANNAATGARVLCGLSCMALIVSFNDFC